MSQCGESDDVAAQWLEFRTLTGSGHSAQALELADLIIEQSHDPRTIAQAMIEKLAALLNLGHATGLGSLLDQIDVVLRQAPDPRLIAEYQVLAAAIAYEHGSLRTAIMRLAYAERTLQRTGEVSLAVVDTWHDLSGVFSDLGFHPEAAAAMRQGQRVCATAGLPREFGNFISVQVVAALAADHRGDTEGCVRALRAVTAGGVDDEPVVMERVYLRYAVARLAALGHPVDLDVPFDGDVDPVLQHVNTLAEVCRAIARDAPAQALTLLSEAPAVDVFDAVEPLRLRSLALCRLGDQQAALDAEREAFRLIAAQERLVRQALKENAGEILDLERLRRKMVEYADAASTDPLTGLPNRRRITQFSDALIRRGATSMCGILDLDGFKAVNDTHGHGAGDLVLRRIAEIFAGAIRHGDLLARHGGDEFVVILPDTAPPEAERISRRIRAAVTAEDWRALVPGTPVAVSIGWATLTDDLHAALHSADKALYQVKHALKPA